MSQLEETEIKTSVTAETIENTDETSKNLTKNSNIILDTNIHNNIEEGSLIVFNVGDEKNPATDEDLIALKEKLFEMFKDVKGIKILALPHNIKVDKFSVPQLRKIIDETVVSEKSLENNPILEMDF